MTTKLEEFRFLAMFGISDRKVFSKPESHRQTNRVNSIKDALSLNKQIMKLNTIILFSLWIIFISCNGQNTASISTSNANEQGLSLSFGEVVAELDKSILYIFQDKKNNYWFGSNGEGVYRYDGQTILRFSTRDGLLSDQIRGIQEDKSGNIFISSLSGINKFDGQEFTALPIVESHEWKMDSNDLWFSILGKEGENGPYRYDGKNLYHLKFPKHYLEDEHSKKYPDVPWSPYEIYSIYKDRKGNMWFGTANFGICRYDGKTLSWMYEDHLTNVPNGGSFGIRSIFEDREGKFWFCNTRYRYEIASGYSAKNGVNFIDYKRENGMGKLTNNNQDDFPYFFSIIEDKNNAFWMTTYDQGVLQYNREKLTQYLLKEDDTIINLYSIYKDKQDDLWLGTHNAGVYKFNGKSFEKFNP